VFYLSVSLIQDLSKKAFNLGYSTETPCWVVEKATWPSQMVIKGTLGDIQKKMEEAGIKRTALILLGEFLNQKETQESHLYNLIPEK
jgi:precorrin-4/cobalt-precorrin-4 C11-methyltransferase